MAFAPQKCELIHFNKGRKQWRNPVALAYSGANNSSHSGHSSLGGSSGSGGSSGHSVVKPVESARFLGVWLDWRLS
jgi:hypothetical protein